LLIVRDQLGCADGAGQERAGDRSTDRDPCGRTVAAGWAGQGTSCVLRVIGGWRWSLDTLFGL